MKGYNHSGHLKEDELYRVEGLRMYRVPEEIKDRDEYVT